MHGIEAVFECDQGAKVVYIVSLSCLIINSKLVKNKQFYRLLYSLEIESLKLLSDPQLSMMIERLESLAEAIKVSTPTKELLKDMVINHH